MNKSVITCLFICSLLLSAINIKAQRKNKDGWVSYERGFEFRKGIYTSFNEFKNNAPGVTANFENRSGVLYIENDSLKKWTPYRKSHWGYSNGKNIYLRTYGGYTRIGIIGELSYFGIAGNNPGGSSVAMSSAGGVGIGIGVGNASNAVDEYLLDFVTGQFINFKRKNFESILKQRDPLMYEQYKNKKGKKKEKMHLYLSAYNDKHKIYFPE